MLTSPGAQHGGGAGARRVHQNRKVTPLRRRERLCLWRRAAGARPPPHWSWRRGQCVSAPVRGGRPRDWRPHEPLGQGAQGPEIDQSLELFIVAVRSDNGSCYFHWRRACGQAVQRQLLLGDAADGSAAGGDGGTGTGPRSLRLLLYQHSSSRGRPIDDR
jgi:hypothetical protein